MEKLKKKIRSRIIKYEDQINLKPHIKRKVKPIVNKEVEIHPLIYYYVGICNTRLISRFFRLSKRTRNNFVNLLNG
jgi:hypothetical protein